MCIINSLSFAQSMKLERVEDAAYNNTHIMLTHSDRLLPQVTVSSKHVKVTFLCFV